MEHKEKKHKIDIEKFLSDISKIQNEELKYRVKEVWMEAWEQSSFENLYEVGFAEEVKNYTLIEHIQAATRCAVNIADVVNDIYKLPINLDYLIAGSLLHDVDKVIIHRKMKDPSCDYEENICIKQHGQIGAEIAQKKGIPSEVIHIILSHTYLLKIVPKTIEAIILRYADHVVGEVLFHSAGLPLLIERFGN